MTARKSAATVLREKLAQAEDQLGRERSRGVDLENAMTKIKDEMKEAYNEGIKAGLQRAEAQLKASEGWAWWKGMTPGSRRFIAVVVVLAVLVMAGVALGQ